MQARVATTPMLAVQGVSRRFGETLAIDNVSLTLGAGEIICLVGQSGCGKSSLLRIIAGVDRPDSGQITLNEAEIAGPGNFVEPEARNIGFMFQDYALFPHLTVADNIAFGLKGRPKASIRARVKEVMARVGVSDMARRYPHTLSGGEQQRIALARALAPQPLLLLMDEPFSNLDRGLSEFVREETLKTLRDLGTAAIIVTHDPEEAMATGDRVVLMQGGRIVQTGSGRDLHDRPNSLYAAEFLRPCNRLAGVVRNGCVATPLGAFAVGAGLCEGANAIVCIRHHALRLASPQSGTPARVLGCAFLGDVEQLTLQVSDLDTPLIARIMGESPARPGDEVWIEAAHERVLVFPEG